MDERPSGPMSVLLLFRFIAELAMLAALAWGGWNLSDSAPLSLAAAVVLPAAGGLVWVELVLFMVAFVLLTRSEPQPDTIGWALAMLLVYLISMPARHVRV